MTVSLSLIMVICLVSAVGGATLSYLAFHYNFGKKEDEFERQEQVLTYMSEQIVTLSNREKELLRKVKELEDQVRELSHHVEFYSGNTQGYPLLAVVGTDEATRDDLIALRQSGVDTLLSYPPTLDAFKKRLDNLRATDRLPSGVHFGLHADESGIKFEDKVATIEWLSENLSGVSVILIAGCSSSDIGFSLSSGNQRVVTVKNEIASTDATLLTRVFWEQMARSKNAFIAFAETRRRLPPVISEMIELH